MRISAVLLYLLALVGCALIEGPAPAPFASPPRTVLGAEGGLEGSPVDPATVAVKALERVPRPEVETGLEVIWQPVEGEIAGYIIRYGFAREALSFTRKILLPEAQERLDPVHGRVLSFIVGDVPADRRVFVTVAAWSEAGEAEPSAVFEVAPGAVAP